MGRLLHIKSTRIQKLNEFNSFVPISVYRWKHTVIITTIEIFYVEINLIFHKACTEIAIYKFVLLNNILRYRSYITSIKFTRFKVPGFINYFAVKKYYIIEIREHIGCVFDSNTFKNSVVIYNLARPEYKFQKLVLRSSFLLSVNSSLLVLVAPLAWHAWSAFTAE